MYGRELHLFSVLQEGIEAHPLIPSQTPSVLDERRSNEKKWK
jgi:hypothetical protein